MNSLQARFKKRSTYDEDEDDSIYPHASATTSTIYEEELSILEDLSIVKVKTEPDLEIPLPQHGTSASPQPAVATQKTEPSEPKKTRTRAPAARRMPTASIIDQTLSTPQQPITEEHTGHPDLNKQVTSDAANVQLIGLKAIEALQFLYTCGELSENSMRMLNKIEQYIKCMHTNLESVKRELGGKLVELITTGDVTSGRSNNMWDWKFLSDASEDPLVQLELATRQQQRNARDREMQLTPLSEISAVNFFSGVDAPCNQFTDYLEEEYAQTPAELIDRIVGVDRKPVCTRKVIVHSQCTDTNAGICVPTLPYIIGTAVVPTPEGSYADSSSNWFGVGTRT